MNRTHSQTISTEIAAIAWLVVIAAGCGGATDSGRFDVDEVRAHESCLDAMFPFEPEFFAARERIDSIGLFMQSKTRPTQDADLVYIEVYDVEAATAGEFGGETLSHPHEEAPTARAEIDIQESCPNLGSSFALEGTLSFDQFETGRGGRISGELTDGSIVDARDGRPVADGLVGEWDFAVQITAPHRSYPTYGDEYPTDP